MMYGVLDEVREKRLEEVRPRIWDVYVDGKWRWGEMRSKVLMQMKMQTQVQTQLQGQYNNEKQLPNPNPLKGLEEKEKEKWAMVQQDCDWKNVQVSL